MPPPSTTPPMTSSPKLSPLPLHKARSASAAAGRKNLQQLIQLRWIAVVGQLLTIEVTHYSLRLPLLRKLLPAAVFDAKLAKMFGLGALG